jgi:hypothetical protein
VSLNRSRGNAAAQSSAIKIDFAKPPTRRIVVAN